MSDTCKKCEKLEKEVELYKKEITMLRSELTFWRHEARPPVSIRRPTSLSDPFNSVSFPPADFPTEVIWMQTPGSPKVDPNMASNVVWTI